jgi:prevent-host-death family protein
MTHQVNVYEAKTQLSKLLDWVLAGEDVVIARSGKPVARLIPIESLPEPRIPGIDAGKITIAADFDDPLPEFEEL